MNRRRRHDQKKVSGVWFFEKSELHRRRRFQLESQNTWEQGLGLSAKAGSFQAGKVGRRLKLIEARQEEGGKEIPDWSRCLCRSGRPRPDHRSRNEGKREESPLIADMPIQPPVTQAKVQPESYDSFSQAEDKKKKRKTSSRKPKIPEAVSFGLQTIRKKKWLKVLLYNRKEKFLKPVQKESGLFAWLGLLNLGSLGGGAKSRLAKSSPSSGHKRLGKVLVSQLFLCMDKWRGFTRWISSALQPH